jgi:hypothetical protein
MGVFEVSFALLVRCESNPLDCFNAEGFYDCFKIHIEDLCRKDCGQAQFN